jgi:hypothetical protein
MSCVRGGDLSSVSQSVARKFLLVLRTVATSSLSWNGGITCVKTSTEWTYQVLYVDQSTGTIPTQAGCCCRTCSGADRRSLIVVRFAKLKFSL